MGKHVLTGQRLRSAYSAHKDADKAVAELVGELGDVDAGAVLFFTSPARDGMRIGQGLGQAFEGAPIIGCTTAGEFTERRTATGGVSAVVLPKGVVRRAAASLAELDGGVADGVAAAVEHIEKQMGITLRDADPQRYIGFVLIDGLHGSEEAVNEALGNHAPLLSFVGGSAGDDLKFAETRVYCGNASSTHGAALMLIESAVPYTIVMTCSFEPSGQRFTITEADVPQRTVWQLDGRPAAEVYADAVGVEIDELADQAFMSHPFGLMIDDRPWIRSPQQVVDGRGLKFYCQILPGMEVDLMDSTDLVAETRQAFAAAVDGLSGEVSGGVMFNCILRRLELDAENLHEPFLEALGGIRTAGFHTYGESWLGHINQTLTAVLFGRVS